jgi:hypothetical protein
VRPHSRLRLRLVRGVLFVAVLVLCGGPQCGVRSDLFSIAPAPSVGDVLLDGRIAAANAAYEASGGHEVEALYALLDAYAGDLAAIEYICQASDPFISWKYASQQNPELREAICAGFAADLAARGYDDDIIMAHAEDCALGIPGLVY